MWDRERGTDRERSHDEQTRRVRGEASPPDRPKGYWLFVAVVAGLVLLAILLFTLL